MMKATDDRPDAWRFFLCVSVCDWQWWGMMHEMCSGWLHVEGKENKGSHIKIGCVPSSVTFLPPQ